MQRAANETSKIEHRSDDVVDWLGDAGEDIGDFVIGPLLIVSLAKR